MRTRTLRRRWINTSLIISASVVFLAGILIFPFLVRGVAGRDWQTLSDVGQAYGAISAILSGLALCGVAVSVTVQWRQTVWARIASARERHFELIKLILEDPELSYRGPADVESDREHRRQLVCNLWVSHWMLLWELGELDAESLRYAFDDLFADAVSRDWWRSAGPIWMAHRSRRRREFVAVAWSSFEEMERVSAELAAQMEGARPAPSAD
ncbi:hypothetical protein JIG36_04155 [Actinoplanes sp. LDG1-06]|uniref:DUF4760 domain-containing protein n=1 Tax=Paractinoplanes ovalisporus TaxID=2810368 RepID=A0ABS2A4K8_9ACTN|nr:DUF6082 family protein [Actinoplanes ovalisporus]MBM2614747.1 hypothetical protein [Actinoplanes ovalisporus]